VYGKIGKNLSIMEQGEEEFFDSYRQVELIPQDFMEKIKIIQMPDPKDLNMYDPR
jgi:hypothetical protein